MTPSELAAKMDHTILKPESSAAEVEKVAREGVQYKFASICIAPAWVKTVAGILKGSGCIAAGCLCSLVEQHVERRYIGVPLDQGRDLTESSQRPLV